MSMRALQSRCQPQGCQQGTYGYNAGTSLPCPRSAQRHCRSLGSGSTHTLTRRRWHQAEHRPHAAAGSSGSPQQQPSPEEREAIRANVDKATQMLEEILEEISDEIFIAQATAYLTDEPEEGSNEAVRQAVARRLEFLDANFLAALNAYVQVAEAQRDTQMLSVIIALREEVLAQVSEQLPPAARVLDLALRQVDKDERLKMLKAAMDGGDGSSIPAADASSLAATASQFIDDMEEQEMVPDRRLLARLCLVHEEVRLLDLERSFSSGGGTGAASVVRSNVPQRCIAFLKELIKVTDPARRAGLMQQAFAEDWTGSAGRSKAERKEAEQAAWEAQQAGKLGGGGGKKGVDYIRPGRFMGTLHAMLAEMERSGAAEGEGGGAVLRRLDDIKLEAMAVLDRMQRAQS